MQIEHIKTKDLRPNTGQIEGLPKNPRQWTKEELDNLAQSIDETPELFEMRPCIVMPHEGAFVILGGNMRHAAAKQLKLKECPCIIVPEGTSLQKKKEIVIKDNGSFGAWDYDMLANEWDDQPLTEWGVPAWDADADANADDYGEEFNLPDGDKPATNQITFYFSAEQKSFVEDMLAEVEVSEDDKMGNENKHGNALFAIVRQWAEQRK